MKAKKYETQTDLEKVHDHPRLTPQGDMRDKRGIVNPRDVKTFVQILMEHNRAPGAFDYNYNQNFYSHNNDIDQEAYLVVGARDSKYAHSRFENGRIELAQNDLWVNLNQYASQIKKNNTKISH